MSAVERAREVDATRHIEPRALPIGIERIRDPAEPVPPLAWPSAGLFVADLALWLSSSVLYVGLEQPTLGGPGVCNSNRFRFAREGDE